MLFKYAMQHKIGQNIFSKQKNKAGNNKLLEPRYTP